MKLSSTKKETFLLQEIFTHLLNKEWGTKRVLIGDLICQGNELSILIQKSEIRRFEMFCTLMKNGLDTHLVETTYLFGLLKAPAQKNPVNQILNNLNTFYLLRHF